MKFIDYIDPKTDPDTFRFCEMAVNAALSFLLFPLILFVFAIGLWFPAFQLPEERP